VDPFSYPPPRSDSQSLTDKPEELDLVLGRDKRFVLRVAVTYEVARKKLGVPRRGGG
jgi:hypothetical protein